MNLNNNHKNCGFGEDAAAYLYGEIGKREKVNFETHLAKCDSCADEIADFTTLRSGIADWKTKSFDIIATPDIEIPYQRPAPSVEIRTEKISWLDSLKNALTFSPAMAMISATIVLALFGGISYLVINSNGEEVASNKMVKPEVITLPVANDKKPDSAAEETETTAELPIMNVSENETEKADSDDDSTPIITKAKVSEKPRSGTITNEPRKQVKPVEPKPKTTNIKTIEENSPVQAQNRLPKLNTLPDDDEIEELRLSDLLSDADSK